MKSETKQFFYKYRHFWLLSYELLYLVWFTWLQGRDVPHTIVHSSLDDLIPFWEVFAIPYFLWFVYVFLGKVVFFFKSPELFVRHAIFLYGGMTFCLLVYTFWPNGQDLRPDPDRTNIFLWAVRWLWSTDPPYNVLPSIHVYNSIGTTIAFWRFKPLKKYPILYYGSPILTVLIAMSTVFLKQHSILDVFAAMALAVPFYFLVFRRDSKLLQKLYQ